jgi:(2R)-sulfolactate sulfo-lyase subunit alpha
MTGLTRRPETTTIRAGRLAAPDAFFRGRRLLEIPAPAPRGAPPKEDIVIHCVLHDPNDSVAVVVVEGVRAGTSLTGLILDEDRTIELECRQDIPIGHKVALKDMAVGETVIKYGVDVGRVVQPIRKGDHAHVHNIKTKRW